MRYLSQLARESRARLILPRIPSWLPSSLAVREEAAPAKIPSQLAERNNVTKPAASGPQGEVRSRERAPNFVQRREPAIVVDRAPQRHLIAPAQTAMARAAESVRVSSESRSAPEPSGEFLESRGVIQAALVPEVIPPSPEVAAMRPRRLASEKEELLGVRTLQSVIAEVARRQEELELRNQTRQSTALARPPAEREIVARQNVEGVHEADVLLNIGSIVVQVDPAPSASPLPPQRPAPPVRDTSDRWARSFLDR